MNYNSWHLIVPMSGQGIRFKNAGELIPKPFNHVANYPMIERAISCYPSLWKKTFVLNESLKSSYWHNWLIEQYPKANIAFVPVHNTGPLLAVEEALKFVNKNEKLMITYCDFGFEWNLDEFELHLEQNGPDSCVMTYSGFHPHYLISTKFAFCRMQDQRVIEVREKENFSDNVLKEPASAGAYYFKNVELLKDAIKFQRQNNLNHKGEYYISLTIEALIRSRPQSLVTIFKIPFFYQWGTPMDVAAFDYWYENIKLYRSKKSKIDSLSPETLIVLAAGNGSRLKLSGETPKPWFGNGHRTIIECALDSFPNTENKIIIGKKEHRSFFNQTIRDKNVSFFELNRATSGSAETLKNFDFTKINAVEKIAIACCDFAFDLDPSKWKAIIKNQADVFVVFTKNLPSFQINPTQYTILTLETHGGEEFVLNMNYKSQISKLNLGQSSNSIFIGVLIFKNLQVLENCLNYVFSNRLYTNNESSIDFMIESALIQKFKVVGLQTQSCFNFGDDASFMESNYWKNALKNVDNFKS